MDQDGSRAGNGGNLLDITANVVSSYVARNPTDMERLPEIIRSVHAVFAELQAPAKTIEEKSNPAVPVGKSVTPDYLICLEDGRKLKMLKRYLRSRYNLTPEEYRARWNLPADYPMVAPNYAKRRSEFAKEIGLGRKRGT